MRAGLEKLAQTKAQVKAVRGKGLLQGLVLEEGIASSVLEKACENKVLILLAGPDVIRILPPLTATKEEIDQLLETLDRCLS